MHRARMHKVSTHRVYVCIGYACNMSASVWSRPSARTDTRIALAHERDWLLALFKLREGVVKEGNVRLVIRLRGKRERRQRGDALDAAKGWGQGRQRCQGTNKQIAC